MSFQTFISVSHQTDFYPFYELLIGKTISIYHLIVLLFLKQILINLEKIPPHT